MLIINQEKMIVILENIRSAHNVGAIMRTADAIGAEKLYLIGTTPSPLDKFGRIQKEIEKTALGADKNIPWEHRETTRLLITKLKKAGYEIYALEQATDSVDIAKFVPPENGNYTIILGNEVDGVSKSTLKAVDKKIEIPMFGKKESLNVSVAFGILAYASYLNKKRRK